MSRAISVGHDVRGGEKLIPSHKPFHQCHALLNYHQPVSGAICKWPLPNPDGGKKVYWSSRWPTEYQWALNYPKWMKATKRVNGGTEMSKENTQEVSAQSVCISFPWQSREMTGKVNRLCLAAAREVWWQPWPLSDKQPPKKNPFR